MRVVGGDPIQPTTGGETELWCASSVGGGFLAGYAEKGEARRSRKSTDIWDTTRMPDYLASLSTAAAFCSRLWISTFILPLFSDYLNVSSGQTESARHHPAQDTPFLASSCSRTFNWLPSSLLRAAFE